MKLEAIELALEPTHLEAVGRHLCVLSLERVYDPRHDEIHAAVAYELADAHEGGEA